MQNHSVKTSVLVFFQPTIGTFEPMCMEDFFKDMNGQCKV